MLRRILILFFLCCTGIPVFAQDLSNIQIHGFATQGVLYSNNNNFFTANSLNGNVAWTDGVISVADSVTDKLRIGIQLHMYQLGQLGGPEVNVDWVSGDYRFTPWLGIRAGKVKTRLGLFNDSQDVDAVFLWSILPESTYPIDNKSFLLSHLGFDVYGTVDLGKRAGKVSYTGYAGYRTLDLQGGYVNGLSQPPTSQNYQTAPYSSMYGGDIHWLTPLKGVTLGASALVSGLTGTSPNGSINIPPELVTVFYGQYERGKFFAAGEYRRNVLNGNIVFTNLGGFVSPFTEDLREWYVMTAYRVLPKLQIGTYYSRYENKAADTTIPANYSKDWTISGRYDFNQYFYAKIEGHFVHGTALDYYVVNNPNGFKVNSNLLVAKFGFTF